MARELRQTALIVSTTQAEHDEDVAFVESRYGAGGINEGKVGYTIDGLVNGEYIITLTRTLSNYKVNVENVS